MAKKQIIYVTGNQLKVDYLKSVLNSTEFEIIANNINCPEIQSDSIEEVAAYSSKYASNALGCDVLKNDSGLVIPALNGFPNAYTKYVEQTLGPDGILALLKGKTNRTAYYLDAFAYTKFNEEPKIFVAKSYGTIAKRKSGKFGNGYDKVFIPQGKTKTMASMTKEEFLSCFNDQAALDLANYLKNS